MKKHLFLFILVLSPMLASAAANDGNLVSNNADQMESLYGEWWLVGWNDGGTYFEVDPNYVSHRHFSIEIPIEGSVMAYSMANSLYLGLLTLNGNEMIFGGEKFMTQVYCDIKESQFFEDHIWDIKSYQLEGNLLKLYYTDNDYFVFTSDLNNRKEAGNDYRPFVEDGKVWKVGGAESGNPVNRVEYYYFDGDTIVNGKTCKQMMRQRFVSPNHPDYAIFSQWPSLSYVGAWYEEDKKVYFCKEKSKEFNMMYDFSLDANETFQVDNGYVSYVIGPRETGGIKGFKGVYRDIMWASEQSPYPYNTTWLEGVGNIDGPMYSVYLGKEDHALFLMSCTVGDEVIYLNDEYEDGATSDVCEARKVRFDFTHTVKTQPRTRRRVPEKTLYGEFNAQQLDINLDPLNETYQVRITDETGKVVYEKSINAGNIVGLNIDISAFTEGCYTVSVENSHESFTGEFNSNTTGIEEIRSRNSELSGHYIYDLQGRKINAQSSILNAQLPKGIYIQNGKKVVVR